MTTYIALLRGINVGGQAKLPMAELRDLAEKAGMENVRTYIQSGNVVFESALSKGAVTKKLEKEIEAHMQKHIAVMVRSQKELRAVLAKNPFPKADPKKVGVIFFKEAVPKDFKNDVSTPGNETVHTLTHEVYIHYPDGMGRSKLKLPTCAKSGTMRNINTIQKLVELAKE